MRGLSAWRGVQVKGTLRLTVILFLYNAALLLLVLLGAPVWALRPRWRASLRERLGAGALRTARALAGRRPVWLHAVSVGEVVAITRLVKELDARLGAEFIVISTTTQTGQELARQRFGAVRCFYFPLDLPWVVRRAMRAIQPRALVLAESELWPNVLAACERQSCPVIVVNARVSDRSLPRYRQLRALWRPFLGKLSLVLSQSAEDARRFVEIGVAAARVRVAGNLKYDAPPPRTSLLVDELQLRLPLAARVFVAGSTLEDEERVLLEAWPTIRSRVPNAVMVLAPRHPERFDRVALLVQESGEALLRRSSWRDAAVAPGSVFLLDSIGELGSVYGLAAVAFVGGSLVAAGGHSPLEPAQCGVPVLMGPHYENFRDAVALLRGAEALRVIERSDVAGAVAELLAEPAAAVAMGERGRTAFAAQAGATARAVEAILALLPDGAGA